MQPIQVYVVHTDWWERQDQSDPASGDGGLARKRPLERALHWRQAGLVGLQPSSGALSEAAPHLQGVAMQEEGHDTS